ncbi:hypothetical protein GQ464_006270 [Rhodocaloribacter litoris]|uniref:hypothetical protein n=1 Tax=Rhodocaloribacter litoris TaxID=2558931 RepID=UPI0014217227|nr:hypothetical protein [Rhodocaloribacter litoris]QXD16550.1 hypothetical protein GQ464_006270 [Rhodocaloribacter litoris]GIV59524.1 MAG: hypothetical protein KatS3mg043_0613 [Rhodothermaceae bacterium]
MHRLLLTAGLLMILARPAATHAQDSTATAWPEASPGDVVSIDAILAAVYDVISGPAGEARDWDRFRSLFHPEARLIPVAVSPEGAARPIVLSPNDYAQNARRYFDENSFYETELFRVTEQYGHIAQVFSTYASWHHPDDPEPFARGINSFQLLHDGNRWWILNIFWDSERTGGPIPAKYLPANR